MLMIKKNGVDDTDLELYKAALKIVKDATVLETTGEVIPATFVKVTRRKNEWE